MEVDRMGELVEEANVLDQAEILVVETGVSVDELGVSLDEVEILITIDPA